MTLASREKAIALIASGIAVYSTYLKSGKLPQDTTIFDFVLKGIPDSIRKDVTADLIDEVFEYVSSTHS